MQRPPPPPRVWSLLAALLVLSGVWLESPAGAAMAADAPNRATCMNRGSSAPDTEDPAAASLGAQLRRANALIDQGCYQDAVAVLEAAANRYPGDPQVAGKLRDVRSMLTEDTYIRDMTQAEDAAKLQHSQLRCHKFGDIEACNESLKAAPNDTSLILAKADALMQAGHAAEAAPLYARVAQLNPADDSVKAKLAEARQSATATAATAPPGPVPAKTVAYTPPALPAPRKKARVILPRPEAPAAPSAPAPAALVNTSAPVYSNDAPPGRSN